MSEISKNIVSLIVSKEFHKAKMFIHEAMNNKLGILLEEKLLEYGPTLYEGEDTAYTKWLKEVGAIDQDENEIVSRSTSAVPQTDKKSSAKSRLDTIDNIRSYISPIWNASLAAGLIQATPEAFKNTSLGLVNLGVKRVIPTAGAIQNVGPILSYAAGKTGLNTVEVAAKAKSLIHPGVQKGVGLGLRGVSKVWKPLMIGADIISVADNSMRDTDWKDKPLTAASTLGVDIAKHAALTAPWLLPFAQTGVIGAGALIGTGLAYGINKYGIDKVFGTNQAELQIDPDTYVPKNIVQGAKAVVSSKEDIEKETQSEFDEFKKEVESSGRGQAIRDADAEGAKITAQFDADQKKKQAEFKDRFRKASWPF